MIVAYILPFAIIFLSIAFVHGYNIGKRNGRAEISEYYKNQRRLGVDIVKDAIEFEERNKKTFKDDK